MWHDLLLGKTGGWRKRFGDCILRHHDVRLVWSGFLTFEDCR